MKKLTKLICFVLVAAMSASLLAGCGLFGDNGNGDNSGNNNTGPLVAELPEIIDYGVDKKYYEVSIANYDTSARADAEKKLDDKIALQDFDEDSATYTKIFYSSTGKGLVDSLWRAALPQPTMLALVDYIAAEDNSYRSKGYEHAVDGLFEDYDRMNELQDAYDADSSDDNDYALQMHRYEMMDKLIKIYGENGGQFARSIYYGLIYSYEVVKDVMLPRDKGDSVLDWRVPSGDALVEEDNYYKYQFEDYETLVYKKAMKDLNAGDKLSADYVRLYGYYYHYEKKGQDVLPKDKFSRRLRLSYMSVMTDNEALEYRDLNKLSYEGSYRYSAAFYSKYYNAHFKLNEKQEYYDKIVYTGGSPATDGTPRYKNGIGAAVATDSNLSYTSEMRAAFNAGGNKNAGIASQLRISDVEHAYANVDANVKTYNTASSNWNKLTEDQQNLPANGKLELALSLEKLKAQHYIITYTDQSKKGALITSTGNTSDNDFSNALKYQIKSYSADNIRSIQLYKKQDVTYNDELNKLVKNSASAAEIDAQKDKIGRNNAYLIQLTTKYATNANISSQMNTASGHSWVDISTEMFTALAYDYSKVAAGKEMDTFENNLIKKSYSCGLDSNDSHVLSTHTDAYNRNSSLAGRISDYNECAAKGTSYDIRHKISLLLNSHETVLLYANGQVKIRFMVPNSSELASYRVHAMNSGAQVVDNDPVTVAAINASKTGFILGSSDMILARPQAYSKEFKALTIENDVKITNNDLPTLTAIYQTVTGSVLTGQDAGKFQYTYRANSITGTGKTAYVSWYIDKDLKYPLRAEDTYDFDLDVYLMYDIKLTRNA